jgi:hypothetical protein
MVVSVLWLSDKLDLDFLFLVYAVCLLVLSQDEPVYSDSTITDEPLVQHTDEILNADDEDAHPSTDTVDSADEDESAGSASQQITDDETVQEVSVVS